MTYRHTATGVEVAVLRAEIHELRQDIQELKATSKRLEQFMYQFEGGKAWMFGLIGLAGAVGALFSTIFRYVFPHN